jgi:hypothetical protein
VLAHLDALVFPLVEVGHLGLLRPFRGVADSHPDAVCLWGADLDVVRRACLDTVDAIPERHRGLPVRLDEAVEKLAGREPRLAGVVPGHLDPASAVFPGLPAWVALVERWARLRVEAELYIPGEALFAA